MKTSITRLSQNEVSKVYGGLTPNQKVMAWGAVMSAITLSVEGIGGWVVSSLIGVAAFAVTFSTGFLRNAPIEENTAKALDKAVFGISMAALKSLGGYFWNKKSVQKEL